MPEAVPAFAANKKNIWLRMLLLMRAVDFGVCRIGFCECWDLAYLFVCLFVATPPTVIARLHLNTETGWCAQMEVYSTGQVRVRQEQLSERPYSQ